MGEIIYRDIHDFEKDDLKEIFLSVGWSSGHFSDKIDIVYEKCGFEKADNARLIFITDFGLKWC